MLRTQRLRYRYADGGPEMAFPDSTWTADRSCSCSRPGTGKTTLLHLIAACTPATPAKSPSMRRLQHPYPRRRDLARGRHMGICPDRPFCPQPDRLGKPDARSTLAGLDPDPDRIAELLAGLGLSTSSTPVWTPLRRGEQRVSIARAVVHGPGIILADEHERLDDANTDAVLDLLRTRARKQGPPC